MGVLLSELWKAWALPWKLVVIEGGRWRSAAALRIAVTAFPIVLLAARLKLSVTEGNWPWWFSSCPGADLGTTTPSLVNLRVLLNRLSRICCSRMRVHVVRARRDCLGLRHHEPVLVLL